MKRIALSRRGKVVASVLSGALVVGGCGGAALALTSGPSVEAFGEHQPGSGDGLSRYVLTLEPATGASLLDDAVLASAVVPLSGSAGVQPPSGAESLGPGGRVVQIAGTAYYVTALGGVAVTPGASTSVLSPEELAQWASQNGVHLDLPGAAPRPTTTPTPRPTSPPPAVPTTAGGVTDEQLAAIQDSPGVVTAQRLDAGVHVSTSLTLDEARSLPGVVAVERSAQAQVLDTREVRDPYRLEHGWNLENTGWAQEQAATADADVDADQGWLANEGEGQVIAVVDTGFDLDHPDLAASLWTNPSCGSDADRDGIVGDCHGWNFVTSSPDVDRRGDLYTHGTNVAGVAASPRDNGHGSAGVAPRAQIMPLVIGDGNGLDVNLGARAIRYAADHGATVINASWGGPSNNGGADYAAVRAAIAYAGSKGVLTVAAAGNDARDREATPLYPASLDNDTLITVGNSTAADGVSRSSAWGASSVDLFAPGQYVFTTWNDGGYRLVSGTSISSPQVAAAVAMYRTARPDLSAAQIKEQLLADATRLPAFAGRSVTGARLDLANLGASASGVQYAFSGMSGASGPVAPQVDVTATTGAGEYALSLGLAMQVDGEPWAVADAPVTLDGRTVTTDDDGFAAFPLGSLGDFGTRTFAPGLTLGDGTYALVAQLVKDGTPVGRPFAAPLLVGAAAEQTPGSGSGSGTGTGGSGSGDGGAGSSGPDRGGDTGSGSAPGSGGGDDSSSGGSGRGDDSSSGGSGRGDDSSSGGGDGSRDTGTGGSGGSGGGSDGGSGGGDNRTPGTTSPVDREPANGGDERGGGDGGGSTPGRGGATPTPEPTPTSPTRPEVPSSGPSPDQPGRGGGADSSPVPSSTPSPSGTRTYDSVGDFDVTALTPTVVGTAGGTTVRASGRGFSYRVSVRVGDAAAQVVSAQDGELTFVVPARSAGTYDVVVFAPGRESVLTGGLTYRDSDSGNGSGGGSDSGTGGGTGGGSNGSDRSGSGGSGGGTGGSDSGGSGSGGGGGGSGGGDSGNGSGGGGASPAPTTRTGPNGERLTKSAKLSGVGYVWSTQCRTTCTGTRL